jgi:hypothetical protein
LIDFLAAWTSECFLDENGPESWMLYGPGISIELSRFFYTFGLSVNAFVKIALLSQGITPPFAFGPCPTFLQVNPECLNYFSV